MLCRKFKSLLVTKSSSSQFYRPLIHTRSFSKWFDVLSSPNMTSTTRLKLLRDIVFTRFRNGWSRSNLVSCMVRRCRTDKGVRDVLQYFREVFFRPRKMHFLVGASAFKKTEEKPGPPKRCSRNIKDKDMEKLISDLEGIELLSRATLYCEGCDQRIVIDAKQPGVRYCSCPDSKPTEASYEGWVPYMEAADIIIWRKEYKTGGLYAYKVYGRYKHLKAEDFAMIQIDGAYRKQWDSAVASLAVVERDANGIHDQFVLHWEVLWPRLFANRDYVYIRRHKEFDVETRPLVHKDGLFGHEHPQANNTPQPSSDRTGVHASAKEKSMEMDKESAEVTQNKVYVIVSRSCTHPAVPESKNAIRVMEYWSHMVVTTLHGPDQPGMEFVLTYYDEPSVGGLPTAVSAWAMARAGPAFLERMRTAAEEYRSWRARTPTPTNEKVSFGVEKVSLEDLNIPAVEQTMSTSKEGPVITTLELDTRQERGTQTRPVIVTPVEPEPAGGPCAEHTDEEENKEEEKKEEMQTEIQAEENDAEATLHTPIKLELVDNSFTQSNTDRHKEESFNLEEKSDKVRSIEREREEKEKELENVEDEKGARWWRYLYPFYYFV